MIQDALFTMQAQGTVRASCRAADNARAATALQAIAEMFDIRDGGAPSLQQPCMLVTGLQGVAKALGGYAG